MFFPKRLGLMSTGVEILMALELPKKVEGSFCALKSLQVSASVLAEAFVVDC